MIISDLLKELTEEGRHGNDPHVVGPIEVDDSKRERPPKMAPRRWIKEAIECRLCTHFAHQLVNRGEEALPELGLIVA